MMPLQQTEKVPGKSHTYRRTNRHSATNSHKFAGSYLQMIKHKGQVRAVLMPDKSPTEFHTIQVISPTEARVIIGWLARYIALSDPDPISMAIASSKAHANRIISDQTTIARELGLK